MCNFVVTIMRLLVFISLILITVYSSAQFRSSNMNQRKHLPLVDFGGRYKMSGWMIEPGITWNSCRLLNPEEEYDDQTIKINPGGKLGAYFGIGRYNIFYKGGNVFNYMDYSLAYKMLRGKEKITGAIERKGKYSHNYLLGNFNINNVIQFADNLFLQNSLGLNLDWRFITRQPHNGPNASVMPSNVVANIHYKFGIGFKLNDRLFVIPTLETPILNLYNFEKFKSTWGIFSSRYRPIIFSVRIAWLRPIGRGDCPPVYASPDDKKAQENFQMR